ncbi:MAG TPA: RHS repeat-associated core domain-containing protein [Pyrinomonadaceae bacterium]|nr:RHS repeat-associated core domain-containing protein [Pyrinomonadaceae bacterium]
MITCPQARRIGSLLLILLASALLAIAQDRGQYDHGTPPQHAAGVSPLGSYTSSDLGTINLTNGALNIKLPLGSVGGRGFSLPLTLNYSSKVWSASRDSNFADETGYHPVAYANYADVENLMDLYSRVAPGWTIGAVPTLIARGSGIGNNISNCTNDYNYALTKLTVILPDKGEIQLRDDTTNGAPLPAAQVSFPGCFLDDGYRGRRWHATDGSGIVFISDNDNGVARGDVAGVLITADGTRYRFINVSSGYGGSVDIIKSLARAVSITDRNGNTVQISYPNGNEVDYTDQLGRVTKIQKNIVDPNNPSVTLALLVTISGYQGQSRYYKVKTLVMNQRYRAGINPTLPVINGDYDPLGWGLSWGTATRLFARSHGLDAARIDTAEVLSEFVLPDGRSVQFFYNEFGEVAEAQMPTGGKAQYDYQYVSTLPAGKSLPGEISTSHFDSNVSDIERAVVARRTYADGVTKDADWSYSYATATAQVTATSTAGAVLLNQKHYFLANGRNLYPGPGVGTPVPDRGVDGSGYNLWSTGVEQRAETLNADGTAVIAATEQDWTQRTPIVWTGTNYVTYQTENDNRINEERKILDTGSTARTDTFYDQYNNPIEVDEYDFDQSLKRRTITSYLTTNNGYNYVTDDAIHLLRLGSQQSVFDGGGTERARTITEYDNYAGDGNHAALQDYGSATQHDPNYGQSRLTRGNPTAVGHWLDLNNTIIYSYPRYDTLGNIVSAKDPRGNVTSLSFADDFGDGSNPGGGASGAYGATYALPTLISSPPPTPGAAVHTARSQYDFSTGLLTGFKDRNGIITQTLYNDPFDRPTVVKAALGINGVESHAAVYYAPATVFGITLTNNDMLTAKDQTSVDDAMLRSWTHTDGFGRTVETWSRDPQGDDKVATIYDALSRAKQTSNPFRPSLGESAIYTTTAYDLAGRVTTVTTPDSAVVTSSYSGNTVTVTDQAGKARKSVTDGLGRLTTVYEDPSGLNYATSYSYDTLDDLTTVSQGSQTRTFVYDSLKRLTSAANPESGTVGYSYDSNGNQTSKTDARSITASYTYDAINRAVTRSYSDGTPAVTYNYDSATNGKGRLASASSSVSTTNYTAYDALGKVTSINQVTDGQTYSMSYAYNLAGSLSSITYPSGRVILSEYDEARRLAGVRDQSSGVYYAGAASTDATNRMQYAAHGAVSVMKLGNGLWEHTSFNNRLQPTQIGMGTSGTDSSTMGLSYSYGTTTNNGNLQSVSYSGGGLSYTQSFGYDALNRLTTSNENSGSSWSQTNGYDQYGNRWIDYGGGVHNLSFSTTTNRITTSGYSYDAAGNLTNDSIHSYGFDAENKIKMVDGVNGVYGYDGDGNRVRKNFALGEQVRMVYSGGQLLAEYDISTGSLKKEYVYGAKGLIATIEPSTGTRYTTSDHLGSPRVITSSSAGVVSRHDYMPFGEEIGVTIGGRTSGMGYSAVDGLRQKFTRKERDNETGLDFFGARYYGSVQGRFTGADPKMLGLKQVVNPQRWNRYAYVVNNPLALYDPDGQDDDGQGGSKVIDVFVAISSKQLHDAGVSVSQEALQKIGDKNGYKVNVHNLEQSTIANVEQSLKTADATFVIGHSGPIIEGGKYIALKDGKLGTVGVMTPVDPKNPDVTTSNGIKPESNANVVAMLGCGTESLGLVVEPKNEQMDYVVLNGGKNGETSVTAGVGAMNALVTGYMKNGLESGIDAGNAVLKQSGRIHPEDKGDRLEPITVRTVEIKIPRERIPPE